MIVIGTNCRFNSSVASSRESRRYNRLVSTGSRRPNAWHYDRERIQCHSRSVYDWDGLYKDNEYTEIKFE